jgi:hypothetical protein
MPRAKPIHEQHPNWVQLTAIAGVVGAVVWFAVGDTWGELPGKVHHIETRLAGYDEAQRHMSKNIEETRRAAEKAADSAREVKDLILQQQRQNPYPYQYPPPTQPPYPALPPRP